MTTQPAYDPDNDDYDPNTNTGTTVTLPTPNEIRATGSAISDFLRFLEQDQYSITQRRFSDTNSPYDEPIQPIEALANYLAQLTGYRFNANEAITIARFEAKTSLIMAAIEANQEPPF